MSDDARADARPDEGAQPPSASGATPAAAEPGADGAPRARRPHRRVRTEPVPGSDPNPAPEPRRHASTENDARLRADKPPHWG